MSSNLKQLLWQKEPPQGNLNDPTFLPICSWVFHLNPCFSKQCLVWSLDSAIHQNYLTNSNKLKKKTEGTWGKFVMPCNLLISNTSSFTTYREQWLPCSPQQNNSSQCPSYIFANLFAAWRIKVHPDLRIQWKTRLRRFPVCNTTLLVMEEVKTHANNLSSRTWSKNVKMNKNKGIYKRTF